jgi:uncharacterized protein (DUF169 family)
MSAPAAYAASLTHTLQLQRAPLGVKLLSSAEEYDAFPAPEPHFGVFYCGLARRAMAGGGYKVTAAHLSCETAAHILGIDPVVDPDAHVASYAECGFYADGDVARGALDSVPTLKDTHGLAVMPLEWFTDVEPDIVMAIVTPYQAMRFAQGHAYAHGAGASASSLGMHGMCAETTAATVDSGGMRVSLLCSGARHHCGVTESEMSVSLPYSMLSGSMRGLLATLGACETDVRKLAMMAPGGDPSTSTLAGSTLGAGYFLSETA